MRYLLTVRERFVVTTTMRPLARVAEGALLLLPWLHLVPTLPGESEVKCGAVDVELRTPANGTIRASGRVLETELPMHVHCRVLVIDGSTIDIPEGTEAWAMG